MLLSRVKVCILVSLSTAVGTFAARGEPLSKSELKVAKDQLRVLSTIQRREAIKAGTVWKKTDSYVDKISDQKLITPDNYPKAFAFDQLVSCTYVDSSEESSPLYLKQDDVPGGKTPKFICRQFGDDGKVKDLKIKYDESNKDLFVNTEDGNIALRGAEATLPRLFAVLNKPIGNPEVIAEVASSRLMIALGFGADYMYPVRTACTDCPEDPWAVLSHNRIPGDPLLVGYRAVIKTSYGDSIDAMSENRKDIYFPITAYEKKYSKYKLESYDDQGWKFAELQEFLPEDNPATPTNETLAERIKREAYFVILGMVQHSDSKAEQQRIYCKKSDVVRTDDGYGCKQAVLTVHDLGFTFGKGWNPVTFSKMNLDQWQSKSIWSGSDEKCELSINQATIDNATFRNTKVSNEGRAFAACLLSQLTSEQKVDLFKASKVERWNLNEAFAVEWADVLSEKIEEVRAVSCDKKLDAAELLPVQCRSFL